MSRVVHDPVFFEVKEGGTLYEHRILEAKVVCETRWTCYCGARWTKRGSHLGTYHTCKKCGAGGFLRAT